MFIGSHVSMSAPHFVLGAVQEALSYNANAFMLYSGAPQNTKRRDISELKIAEAHELMRQSNISLEHMIVHAPYIINLANTINPNTYELAVSFLKEEIVRVNAMGAKYLVLHPGSHVKAGEDVGLTSIVKGLDEAMKNMGAVEIALETMAGKGSELGYSFQQLAYIIKHATYGDKLKVCLDTCHIHDAGYDLSDFDSILDEFDTIIGLDRLACIHLNDSKNINGARKDRHANIGDGEIGFDNLYNIANNKRIKNIVKILETPYIDGKAPYKEEIIKLRAK